MSNLIGRLNSNGLKGNIKNNKITGHTQIPESAPYDDTELREIIAENLDEAKKYTDEAIDNYEEDDPTMEEITNQEINELISRWG